MVSKTGKVALLMSRSHEGDNGRLNGHSQWLRKPLA